MKTVYEMMKWMQMGQRFVVDVIIIKIYGHEKLGKRIEKQWL